MEIWIPVLGGRQLQCEWTFRRLKAKTGYDVGLQLIGAGNHNLNMGPVEIPTLITEMLTEIPTETQSTFQRPPKCTPGGREYISEAAEM